MNMHKRKYQIFMLVVICLLFGACAPSGETTMQTAAESTQESATESAAPETIAESTQAPDREVSEVKAGLILYGEENDGSLLTAALRRGLTDAAAGLGIGEDQLTFTYNGREADWTQIEDSILACVEEGCQIVFGGAREYEAVIAAIAEEYPEVMFACVGSELYNGTNSGTYDISLAAASYLCGAAAAMADTSGHIGYLAAKGQGDEDVTNGVNAFAYGVWSVNPQAVVEVGVTGKWFLPQAEEQAVSELLSLGCDVFGGNTDSAAGLRAAMAAGVPVVGYRAAGEELYGADSGSRMTASALCRFETYFAMKLSQVIHREVAGEAWNGDYFGGNVEFSGALELPEEVWEQLAVWQPQPETEESKEIESLPEETAGPEESVMPEENASSGEEVPPEENTSPSEGDAPSEENMMPEESESEETAIFVDEETGYLANVRIHLVEVAEEE
ncbi:MAG: BMP family ABC transporter substrate-binding protein [Lachnospiraceae bacterium]|jgi:basic membrane protein A|nr:BMP family ABC transporter substrate-binding protein [Lachnospiraceae bacterium]